jgi:hypothetical protein
MLTMCSQHTGKVSLNWNRGWFHCL